jgi:hypothetical protein
MFGSTCDDKRLSRSLMSLPVMTASTPGTALALLMSIAKIFA